MILTDREIKIALQKKQITIDPPPLLEAYSSTAVDLTLSTVARNFLSGVSSGINIDPSAADYNVLSVIDLVTAPIDLNATYNLQRGTLLLAWTKETLDIPVNSRLAARVEGKSSLARIGVGVHITAPTIHAGFTGPLQLEIVNHGPAPIVLRSGMRICQIIFETTLGTPEKGYAGQFAGQQAR